MLPIQKHKPCSLGLSPLHGHPSTHHGAVEGVDWRSVGIERCSSDKRVLFPGGKEFCVVWPVISVPQSPVNKFTILTIEDPNTIDSELIDVPPVRATGAQDSRRILRYITVCGYDTTYLQENPQRLGWGSWRDVLHYILGLHSGSLWSELY